MVHNLIYPNVFPQTPRELTIINPGGPQLRRVYLDGPHSPRVRPGWYGESAGRCERGDTLVVDTIGLSSKIFVDNYRTPRTDGLHVVERFELVDAGKMLEDLIAVDDPGAFTMPWSAVQRLRRVRLGPIRKRSALTTTSIRSASTGYCPRRSSSRISDPGADCGNLARTNKEGA